MPGEDYSGDAGRTDEVYPGEDYIGDAEHTDEVYPGDAEYTDEVYHGEDYPGDAEHPGEVSPSGPVHFDCECYSGDITELLQDDEEAPVQSDKVAFDVSIPVVGSGIDERIRHLDKTFQEHLFTIIDRKGLKDPEVYKKANIDRKHFSKIRSNVDYKPSKMTAVALAIALELNLDQTRDLLMRAGLALSSSNIFDLIIEYCIENNVYDIYEINCILFEYDQPLLGA